MTHADSIWANALQVHADSLQSKVDSLQAKLEVLQGKTDLFCNIVETANDGVSNQLASATLWLEVIAILIVIVGGGVGLFVNYKKRQIEDISITVEEKKRDIDRMARETEKLDAQIRHNMSDLYKELRKEETKAILDRLIIEPRDISNLAEFLLAREIEKEYYPKLKTAFLKLQKEYDEESKSSIDKSYKISYLVLFFQHFCFESITDKEMAPYLVDFFDAGCLSAFKRDIKKSTIELCRALSDENSIFKKEEVLVDYLKALNKSQHNNYSDLKIIFEQNINPQSLLMKAIDYCKKENIILPLFDTGIPKSSDNVHE